MKQKEAFVFVEEKSNFPSGVFTTLKNAKGYIGKYSLSGILTQFPIELFHFENGKFSENE